MKMDVQLWLKYRHIRMIEKTKRVIMGYPFKIDKIYRVKMNGVVDRIYTYSEDNQIWGHPDYMFQ